MRERLAGNCDRPLFSGHLAVRTRVRPKLVYDELNGVVTVCVCARARARAVAHLAINDAQMNAGIETQAIRARLDCDDPAL